MSQYSVLRSRQIDVQRDRASLMALVAQTEQFQLQIWARPLTGLRHRPELIVPMMQA